MTHANHGATRVNCFHHYPDVWITPAKTRVKGPSQRTPREPVGDIHSNTRHHPTPRIASRDSKYRCNSVISLPVSTTSYFRHVVSTVQTRSSGPTTVRSSIDTGGSSFSHLFHSNTPTHSRPVSNSFYSSTHFKTKLRNQDPKLESDSNHSTSTEILFSRAFLSTPAY